MIEDGMVDGRDAASNRATVTIASGSPIVGEALELLLETAGYGIKVLPDSVAYKLDELFADVKLLVLAPALSERRRKALLSDLADMPATVKIPILELLDAAGESQAMHQGHVPWPCSMDELKRAIDSALLPALKCVQ